MGTKQMIELLHELDGIALNLIEDDAGIEDAIETLGLSDEEGE